jgi:enamine deaminase RidA (YjgF/YER057c/UK114 family)
MERCFGGGSTISTSLIAVVPEAGYDINKIYPPGVASSPTSGFVPAVICNEFVFVAGQMAHNPGGGLDPRVIVPEHAAWTGIPIRQQTEFLILEKLKPALEAAGSSLEQSVKAQIYLADIADMPDCSTCGAAITRASRARSRWCRPNPSRPSAGSSRST